MLYLAIIFTIIILITNAKRNSEEEEICKTFLTSKSSAPISIHATNRNLKYDEDCEFSCELVLQDQDLPIQIRFVIHQGLGYLALKHIDLGLERHLTALRHFQILMKFDKNSFEFASKVGLLAMEPVVANPMLAVKTFHSIFYGQDISLSKVDVAVIHQCKYLYIKALGNVGDYKSAQKELYSFMRDYPLDFDAFALLSLGNFPSFEFAANGNTSNDSNNNSGTSDTMEQQQLELLVATIKDLTKDISIHSSNNYQGFVPPSSSSRTRNANSKEKSSWEPTRYNFMLSEEVFLDHIHRREPFIIHFDSVESLEDTLKWNTGKWRDQDTGAQYLKATVGDEEEVLTEVRLTENQNTSYFGMGLDVYRKKISFQQLLDNEFLYYDTINQLNYSLYMNIQNKVKKSMGGIETSKYRPPLHLLQSDLTVPDMLKCIWENITEINLWMGISYNSDSQSKLHMDATDNLYIVLEGSKQFTLVSPIQATKLHTVAPTFAVSPDGLSFQFNINKFRDYLINNQKTSLPSSNQNITTSTSTISLDGSSTHSTSKHPNMIQDNESSSLVSSLPYNLSQDITYEVANSHFSQLSSSQLTNSEYDISDISTFELKAGEMLYLPTGWFHQVKSRQGKHTAINYWWRALNWRDATQFEYIKSIELYQNIINKYINN